MALVTKLLEQSPPPTMKLHPVVAQLTGRIQERSAASRQALLHTRLSIIDPRPLADQPMGNAAGDIWLCYNGEVYDWADDAAALSRAASAKGP